MWFVGHQLDREISGAFALTKMLRTLRWDSYTARTISVGRRDFSPHHLQDRIITLPFTRDYYVLLWEIPSKQPVLSRDGFFDVLVEGCEQMMKSWNAYLEVKQHPGLYKSFFFRVYLEAPCVKRKSNRYSSCWAWTTCLSKTLKKHSFMTVCLTFLQSIDFEKFKPVMLAALRSLLPKQWSTKHETAWEWLWLTVARNLKDSQPKKYSWMKLRWWVFHKSDSSFGTEESTMKVRAFKPYNAKLFSSLSEEQLDRFRHSIHLILRLRWGGTHPLLQLANIFTDRPNTNIGENYVRVSKHHSRIERLY